MIVKLGDLINKIVGNEDRLTTSLPYFLAGEHMETSCIAIYNHGELNEKTRNTLGYQFHYPFEIGDVLFMTKNPYLKKCGYATFEGICSIATFVLRSKDESKLTQKFLAVLLQTDQFWDYLEANKSGSVNYFITWKTLEQYEFDLPTIEKQNEIAEIVWAIEETRQSYKKLLKSTDELVKSRFIEMFGTIYNNVHNFNIKTLEEICEPIKDGTHQTPEYTDDTVNGYKFLSSKDVTSSKIDWSNLKYIPAKLHEQLYARIAPQKGDILLAKNGTTGVAAIVDKDDIFDIYVSLALLRPKQMNSFYLWAAINSNETKKQFDEHLKGIGVPNLHLGEIKKTEIIEPPLELQNQFADFVQQVDKSKFELQNTMKQLDFLQRSILAETLPA